MADKKTGAVWLKHKNWSLARQELTESSVAEIKTGVAEEKTGAESGPELGSWTSRPVFISDMLLYY